ncbi:hypothetical protein [Clostridium saccharobutylicum]|uniref:Uncharacterized protein n=1 Tax=Clostridium saccharobutylicum DSM 13864 TaxID=1345695 RepID=U5MXZ1_CLOSA|nr:hypothetical protein [Clostridium saccharobutylicum]AGX44491.1 hypothetical protein CLSA_c35300 [Clostridium saccharobutylicum DSM 13864]AQR91785.1 hypothetical protein CLOSC_35130 [Clostridium saccharobutylicum]AQS01687.1 hypothetical protein CSACC_35180 [Clostridium saccharobutylicum]AQS15670.1 hypothetical protein CLOSACC_35180 [Clostridium saccharobutylicum]MBA2907447.1 hypothetical protein [Clostridium saccharobutylicum]
MNLLSVQSKNLYNYNTLYTKNSIEESTSSIQKVDSSQQNKLIDKNDNTPPKACDILRIDRENKTQYLNGVKIDEKFMKLLAAGKTYSEIINILKTKKNDNTDDEILERIINS